MICFRTLTDIDFLKLHYQIDKFVDTKFYRYDKYGYIEQCVFFPIFEKHAQYFLRELHRQSDLAILFNKLHLEETLPKVPGFIFQFSAIDSKLNENHLFIFNLDSKKSFIRITEKYGPRSK